MKDPDTIPQIEWRADFATGDPAIDHEHKEMIERINEFLVAADSNPEIDLMRRQLGEIYAWISAHFALEEKIMRDLRYAEYDPHKEDHEKLLDELSDMMEEIEKAGRAGDVAAIKTRMSDWFVSHFKTLDARLHSVLATRPD